MKLKTTLATSLKGTVQKLNGESKFPLHVQQASASISKRIEMKSDRNGTPFANRYQTTLKHISFMLISSPTRAQLRKENLFKIGIGKSYEPAK